MRKTIRRGKIDRKMENIRNEFDESKNYVILVFGEVEELVTGDKLEDSISEYKEEYGDDAVSYREATEED